MKNYTFMLSLILMALSQAGYAKETANTQQQDSATTVPKSETSTTQPVTQSNAIFADYFKKQVLIVTNTKQPDTVSVFATDRVAPDILVEWITHLLQIGGAENTFIEKLAPRLQLNPFLKNESFSFPVIDDQGQEYHFEFISDREVRFYTLNYYRFSK